MGCVSSDGSTWGSASVDERITGGSERSAGTVALAALSASATSRTSACRSAVFFASAFARMGTRAGGSAAARGPLSGGSSWRCLKMVAIGVSPRNGTWPVNSSKITMPSA